MILEDSPSRAQRRLGTYILTTSSFSASPFSDVHVDSLPIEVQRADALYDFLQMPNAGKSGSTLAGEFQGGRLDGVSGTLGFPLTRRVSLCFSQGSLLCWKRTCGSTRRMRLRVALAASRPPHGRPRLVRVGREGEHVRLDWSDEPPSRDGRAAAAPLCS